jgi:hypothetical protein
MQNYFCRLGALALTALFVVTGTALARSSHDRTAQVNIMFQTEVANGKVLQPGIYKVKVSNNANSPEVMFYQNNKLVAQTPARMVATSQKSGDTEVHYDTAGPEHVITQIDLRGWNEELMFNSKIGSPAGS